MYLLVIVLAGFFIFKLTQREFRQIEETANSKYPKIDKLDSVSGTVKSIYNPPKLRSSPFLVRINFIESSNATLMTSGYSLNDSDISIRDVSRTGAFLKKKANSDTIEVNLEGEAYKFLID